MNVSAVLDQLKQLGRLYCRLLEEENHRLALFVEGNLEQVEASRIDEEHNLEAVRRLHAALQCELSEVSLSRIAGALPKEHADLRQGLADLDRTMQELRLAIRRSRRYLQNSLSYNQAVAQKLFAGHASYDGEGFVRSECRSLQRGMRV